MLPSVPTGTVSLFLPAITMRASWPAWAQTSWEPLCATFVRRLRNVRKVETVGIEPTSAIA
jgi:hypothetical protein